MQAKSTEAGEESISTFFFHKSFFLLRSSGEYRGKHNLVSECYRYVIRLPLQNGVLANIAADH